MQHSMWRCYCIQAIWQLFAVFRSFSSWLTGKITTCCKIKTNLIFRVVTSTVLINHCATESKTARLFINPSEFTSEFNSVYR
ncbi:hypothetical protein BDF19DRAFT_437025 [Syncephalis fuscata]|nr:hypothetical protein BDF19DRAFT_437025 [Syncephalis fuscata]